MCLGGSRGRTGGVMSLFYVNETTMFDKFLSLLINC